jgi:hypothetical protein
MKPEVWREVVRPMLADIRGRSRVRSERIHTLISWAVRRRRRAESSNRPMRYRAPRRSRSGSAHKRVTWQMVENLAVKVTAPTIQYRNPPPAPT